MSLSRREKTGSRRRTHVLKPSGLLKRYGVELPPDTMEYLDRHGSIEGNDVDIPGWTAWLGSYPSNMDIHDIIRESARVFAKEIHSDLFNGDPRYTVTFIGVNPEVTDDETKVYEYKFIVDDREKGKPILKVYAPVYIYPNEGKYSVDTDYLTLEPLI